MLELDCSQLTPRDVYQLMTRIVAPRPIAFVSTLSSSGCGNLAPFSYFALGGSNPPSVVFCPILTRDGVKKDTLVNIEATGEYVINVATFTLAEQLNQTSYTYPADIDEFDRVGLTRAPSRIVKPPRVAESPINLELKLFDIVRHGSGALASNYIIGEVVYIHMDETVLTMDLPDNRKIGHLARLGEDLYCHVTESQLHSLPRPTEG